MMMAGYLTYIQNELHTEHVRTLASITTKTETMMIMMKIMMMIIFHNKVSTPASYSGGPGFEA
jgi:hypothetical protein